MRKRTKLALGGIAALAGVLILSGCTQSFCSYVDQGRMMYAFDSGVTQYVKGGTESINISTESGLSYKVSGFSYSYASFNEDDKQFVYESGEKIADLNTINDAAKSAGIQSLSGMHIDYLKEFGKVFLKYALTQALIDKKENVTLDLTNEEDYYKFDRDLNYYSYLKFVESNSASYWAQWDKIDNEVRSTIGQDKSPSSDFAKLYKSRMNQNIAQYRTCLTTKTDKYGSYGYKKTGVYIDQKNWSYAWQKGLFEGLLVFPIGWLIDKIAFGFMGTGANAGVAALLAILFVTLIVRSIMMIATIKQTLSNAKMTELQPEITKIQNKYPNANTSNAEKQRMAEEMNRLYKKNKINPFTTLVVMVVQFPVFICVWGALSGSAALSSGTVLGLDLSLTIRQVLFARENWNAAGGYAAVTALFLFLFMAGAQAVSMLLPQWLQKARAKKVARIGKNPAQQQQNNRMKWFTYIMLAMIIFMGFSLVSAMGVYWLVGALISTAQTLITQYITSKKQKNY